ncbi:MAG TPA: hypothetical protein VN226_06425 [Anaerolineales bacterium]|nr:hypothetical protein [Anaerolineales bacterium]
MPLNKPSRKTKFHIDYDWWKKNEKDWHVHLRGLLCETHQRFFDTNPELSTIDNIDPVTGEVTEMDAIQQIILAHCSQQPEFISTETQLVESVFRTFLSNGNLPLDCDELAEKINKSANTILITLSGPRVYKGIRPIV